MSSRSHYYTVVNVGHQQMALEENAPNCKNARIQLKNQWSIFLHIRVLHNRKYVARYIRITLKIPVVKHDNVQ